MKQFISTIEKGGLIKVPAPYTEGERISVTIRKWRKSRSSGQNRLYHGVWLPQIAEELGYLNPEDVCRGIKLKLGLCEAVEDKLTGGKRWECPSTKDYNVAEMADFLLKVEALAQEFNITLPSQEWY